MKGLLGVIMAIALSSGAWAAEYPQPQPNDGWWDIVNINGKTLWLDQDRIWQESPRHFAIVRLTPSNTDYHHATNIIVATDCQSGLKSFGTYEDFRHAPLDPARGIGQAVMRAICNPAQR